MNGIILNVLGFETCYPWADYGVLVPIYRNVGCLAAANAGGRFIVLPAIAGHED